MGLVLQMIVFLTMVNVILANDASRTYQSYQSPEISTGHDATIEPNASGQLVVEATIKRLLHSGIFDVGLLFLRRLACVESTYGTDPETYRFGYHGGIWQVSTGSNLATIVSRK